MAQPSPRQPSALPTEVVSVTGQRDHNEDVGRALTGTARGKTIVLLVVADGMGGHAHGEVASRLATDALSDNWNAFLSRLAEGAEEEAASRAFLRAGFAEAERRIAEHSEGSGMGTTLVAGVIVGGGAILANVGDSRAYIVRDSGAALVTEDHSVVADAVRKGALTPEEAERSPYQHALTRALDGSGDSDPDLFPPRGWLDLGSSAAILLCSDGLSGVVTEDDLSHAIASTPDVQAAARSLVALALERSTPDNVTIALAEHGVLPRSGTPTLSHERIEAALSAAGEAGSGTGGRRQPVAASPPAPGTRAPREVQPRESVGRTPWVLGGLAVLLLIAAFMLWSQRENEPRASTLRGSAVPVATPRPVPSAFALTDDGDHLRWIISGIATRSDSVRITVSFPADTLTRSLESVGASVPLAEVAGVWPGGVLVPGEYIWKVEARSLSGSRLRSGPAQLILTRPVRAFAAASMSVPALPLSAE